MMLKMNSAFDDLLFKLNTINLR